MIGMTKRTAIGLLLAGVAAVPFAGPARAAGEEEQVLVDLSKEAVQLIRSDPDYKTMNELLAKSYGAMVVPELVKAGFILGGEGGRAVLLRRDEAGQWTYPAFYDFGGGSIGLQAGIQKSQVILVFMTAKGLELAMTDKMKFGADASIVVATIGGGAEAATTTNLDADIYAFAKSEGLFGGISLEGSAIIPDQDANQAYYGTRYTSRQIIYEGKGANAGAEGLRLALAAP